MVVVVSILQLFFQDGLLFLVLWGLLGLEEEEEEEEEEGKVLIESACGVVLFRGIS